MRKPLCIWTIELPLNIIMLRHFPPLIDRSSKYEPWVNLYLDPRIPAADANVKVPSLFLIRDTLGLAVVAIFLVIVFTPWRWREQLKSKLPTNELSNLVSWETHQSFPISPEYKFYWRTVPCRATCCLTKTENKSANRSFIKLLSLQWYSRYLFVYCADRNLSRVINNLKLSNSIQPVGSNLCLQYRRKWPLRSSHRWRIAARL